MLNLAAKSGLDIFGRQDPGAVSGTRKRNTTAALRLDAAIRPALGLAVIDPKQPFTQTLA